MEKYQLSFILTKRFLKTFLVKNILIFFLFFFQFSWASKPTPQGIDKKLKEVYNANYSQKINADAAIKMMVQCYNDSKSISYENGIRKSGLYASLLYSNKKDYENSIKISNEIKDLMEKTTDYRSLAEYYKSRALNYSYLGLFRESYKEYRKAINAAQKISDNDIKYYMISVLNLDIASYHEKTQKPVQDSIEYYMVKALQAGEMIKTNGSLAKTGERNEWVINLNYSLGSYYLENDSVKMDLARIYFTKAKKLYENSTSKMMLANEITFLAHLCKFYYKNQNYNEAIKYGLRSLELQKKEPVPTAKKIVYENIAQSYLQIGKQKEYQDYIDKYIALNDSINDLEKVKASTTIENFISKKDQDNNKKNSFVFYTNVLITVIIVLIILFIWKQKNKKIHNNYLSLIERIKQDENKIPKPASIKNINSFNIPEETYQKILFKMEKFEKSLGFLKKDITLSYLSNQFKTNPKSLSLVIKMNKDKTFNNYINGLKISYITQKLYEDRLYREFKINYLSEECGYSSSKVFVTAFKKETGVTPSYYITNLKIDLDGKTE